MKYERQMKVYLRDFDYNAWVVLAERMGVKPATLARRVMVDYLINNGFTNDEAKIMLPEAEGKIGIYFQLDADETAVLDELAWEQHKLRQNVVRELVRNGLQDYLLSKAWGKQECENS